MKTSQTGFKDVKLVEADAAASGRGDLTAELARIKADLDALAALANELRTDHATFKTVVDELIAWAETLATKLNADTGVNDTDYDTEITATTPATLSAGAVSITTK